MRDLVRTHRPPELVDHEAERDLEPTAQPSIGKRTLVASDGRRNGRRDGRVDIGKRTLTQHLRAPSSRTEAPATAAVARAPGVERRGDWLDVLAGPAPGATSPASPTASSSAPSWLDTLKPRAPASDADVAVRGVSGPGGPLPHLAQIQASFGRHDVSSIRAHTDDTASAAATALGAKAYAIGDHIAFAGQPDLFTAAHEAAHVIQQRTGVDTADESWERHADLVAQAVVAGASAEALLARMGTGSSKAIVQRRDARRPPPGVDFGEPSVGVHVLACVKVPDGTYLRSRPLPKAAPTHATPIPQSGRIWITQRTLHANVAARWCYVVAPDHGVAGFVQERRLLLHPPEPQARVHLVKASETLHQIATRAYGKNFEEGNDARLYVQGLYEANRDNPAVKLTPVSLSFGTAIHRREAERETLRVYRGVQVIEGEALWIPSESFIQRLRESGAITSGSSELSKAWRTARDAVGAIVDTIKYVAGFIVGLLEGAWNAIHDLFKGAADLVDGVAKVVWSLVSQGPGAVMALVEKWAGQMAQVWEKKGDLASAFLKKWNASNAWDRGNFHGEVLGWLFMTVLLVLLTMGESAPAALAGVALRWPELVALLKAVDALGDVTRYLGGAAKATALAAGISPEAIRGAVAGLRRTGAKSSEAAQSATKTASHVEGDGAKAAAHAEGGAVKGKDVYPDKTYTKDGKDHLSRLNREKIQLAFERVTKSRKLIHGAEIVVDSISDKAAKLTVRVPVPGKPHIEVHVDLKIADELTGARAHGADTGPARLHVDEAGGTWVAELEIRSALRPDDLDFVVRHELDEAVEIVRRHPTGKPKGGFDHEHRAGVLTAGAAPNAKVTAHDIAAARELDELLRDLRNLQKHNSPNAAHRAQVLERALRAQGFDDLGQLGRKIEVLKEAAGSNDLIRFVKEREAQRLIAGVAHVQPTRFSTDLVAHLMHPRQGDNFVVYGLSGGHHTSELLRYVEAHPKYAVRETGTRTAGGVTMRRFEQYHWKGSGSKPARGSGMAPGERNFAPAQWDLAAVPKTTFDQPHEFFLEAERAWATWVPPPGELKPNTPVTVTAPGSGIRFGGFVNPGPQLTTFFPEATWI
ncbi:MAG: DUF4157 domain-containing protein [Deltaproteobacteria bacterium]|nr:DUF4157 domain-containing protein [Deltaproteobacteria bacterium]